MQIKKIFFNVYQCLKKFVNLRHNNASCKKKTIYIFEWKPIIIITEKHHFHYITSVSFTFIFDDIWTKRRKRDQLNQMMINEWKCSCFFNRKEDRRRKVFLIFNQDDKWRNFWYKKNDEKKVKNYYITIYFLWVHIPQTNENKI